MTRPCCESENSEPSVLGSGIYQTLQANILENASDRFENMVDMARYRELLATRCRKHNYIKTRITAVVFLILIVSGIGMFIYK